MTFEGEAFPWASATVVSSPAIQVMARKITSARVELFTNSLFHLVASVFDCRQFVILNAFLLFITSALTCLRIAQPRKFQFEVEAESTKFESAVMT
jgi:hypothetical protein